MGSVKTKIKLGVSSKAGVCIFKRSNTVHMITLITKTSKNGYGMKNNAIK